MPRFTQVFAPRDRVYFELFEEAGQNMLRSSSLLYELLRTYPDAKQLAAEILDLEHEGDRITHDIIHRLNQTFVTPIDREDIYQLASVLDDVVDYVEEVADFLGLFGRLVGDRSGRLACLRCEFRRACRDLAQDRGGIARQVLQDRVQLPDHGFLGGTARAAVCCQRVHCGGGAGLRVKAGFISGWVSISHRQPSFARRKSTRPLAP